MLNLLQAIATDAREPIGLDNPLRQVIINTHSPAVVGQVPDDSLLVAELKEMVRAKQHFKRACVTDLGFDSIMLMDLAVGLELAFPGLKLRQDTLTPQVTVADLAQAVAHHAQPGQEAAASTRTADAEPAITLVDLSEFASALEPTPVENTRCPPPSRRSSSTSSDSSFRTN